MASRIHKGNDENVNQSKNDIATAIVPSLIALIGVILTGNFYLKVEQMKEEQEIRLYEMQNDYDQCIYSKSSIIEMAGIEYVQYELTTDPIMAGYHVIVYPYVIYEKEDNKVYLPITRQFTQDEYVADENGYCRLLRENTTEDFLEMAESVMNYHIEVKYLMAVQYVKDGELKREVYDVRDGRLTLSDQNNVIEVFKAWEDKNSIEIDMWGWPCFEQQTLERIFI